jgi:Tol biopolymer transport system component
MSTVVAVVLVPRGRRGRRPRGVRRHRVRRRCDWAARGLEDRLIATRPRGAGDPNVSPDGRTVTFRGGDGTGGENGALFRTSINGGPVTQLTPFAFVSIKHDWAPDGRHVLYSDSADTGDPSISINIATVDPDGSHIRHLTDFHGGAVSAFAGSYSADGREIVLRLEDHGSSWLYQMRGDGSHLKPIIALGTLKPRLTDWGPRIQSH